MRQTHAGRMAPLLRAAMQPPNHAHPCCDFLAALEAYDYVFSENGLVAHKAGKVLEIQSLKTFLGEERLKKCVAAALRQAAPGGAMRAAACREDAAAAAVAGG